MKLYAVTLKAGLLIHGIPYRQLRDVPISKFAYMNPVDRARLEYAPAVFTSIANAQKLIKKCPDGHNYKIVEFDSGWVDYPEIG